MKGETGRVAIEEFAGLKAKLYSFSVYNNSECSKKTKAVNKNVPVTISHNKNKYVLLNKKWLRHSMNRMQSKDRRIGTFEINQILLSCYDDKMYIKSNVYDGLALGH